MLLQFCTARALGAMSIVLMILCVCQNARYAFLNAINLLEFYRSSCFPLSCPLSLSTQVNSIQFKSTHDENRVLNLNDNCCAPPVMHVMHARLSDTPRPHLSRNRVSPDLFIVSCGSFVNSSAKVATCLQGGGRNICWLLNPKVGFEAFKLDSRYCFDHFWLD